MLLRVCCLFWCIFGVLASDDGLTWTEMGKLKGQWKISFGLTSTKDKNVIVPHNCSSQLESAPCNQPHMSKSNDDRIRVTYLLKNASAPFKTYHDAAPHSVAVKMCFSPHSFLDRPWRKFKKVIKKDKNCPYTIGKKLPFPANPLEPSTVTMNFNSTTDLATATWYVKVVVYCKGDVVCQFDETNTTTNATKGNFFATSKTDVRSTGMVIAAVVMSAAGPLFFTAFYVLDARRRKNL